MQSDQSNSESPRLPSAEELRSLFREHDLRWTRQRAVVYRTLLGSRSHPTVDELYRAVLGEDPAVSLATVYNTLEALQAVGLCARLAGGGVGCARYDADLSQHVHLALEDGRVVDLPQGLARRIVESLQGELKDEIERHLGGPVRRLSVQIVAQREDR